MGRDPRSGSVLASCGRKRNAERSTKAKAVGRQRGQYGANGLVCEPVRRLRGLRQGLALGMRSGGFTRAWPRCGFQRWDFGVFAGFGEPLNIGFADGQQLRSSRASGLPGISR